MKRAIFLGLVLVVGLVEVSALLVLKVLGYKRRWRIENTKILAMREQ